MYTQMKRKILWVVDIDRTMYCKRVFGLVTLYSFYYNQRMDQEGDQSSKARSWKRSQAVSDNVFRGLVLGSEASFIAL